jgi:large subunit ribosomal protein L31
MLPTAKNLGILPSVPMKKDIHPKVNIECQVTCACGNAFTTISTLPNIHVDICSACHPLFTGTQKLVDTEGRIDKFNRKTKQTAEKQAVKAEITKAQKAKVAKDADTTKEMKNVSLKDMLKQLKEETTSDAATDVVTETKE